MGQMVSRIAPSERWSGVGAGDLSRESLDPELAPSQAENAVPNKTWFVLSLAWQLQLRYVHVEARAELSNPGGDAEPRQRGSGPGRSTIILVVHRTR